MAAFWEAQLRAAAVRGGRSGGAAAGAAHVGLVSPWADAKAEPAEVAWWRDLGVDAHGLCQQLAGLIEVRQRSRRAYACSGNLACGRNLAHGSPCSPHRPLLSALLTHPRQDSMRASFGPASSLASEWRLPADLPVRHMEQYVAPQVRGARGRRCCGSGLRSHQRWQLHAWRLAPPRS